jgi:hypothetical protein
MDGRDLKIPVRMTDLIWTVGSRSDGAGGKGEEDLTVVRVPAISGEVAARWVTPAMLQRLLGNGGATTRRRAMRGSRKRDHRPQLLPDKEKGGGWRRR